jgi:dienelactone hydrolase
VFYPSDSSKKYPLLSFAHGWTEGGATTDVNYKDVLESVAAAGYVVVAHHSGAIAECQAIYPKDQQRAIAYINETAEFSSMVDWTKQVGIYGHSMGGGATGDNAADHNAIATYNIGAAVLLHPVAAQSGVIFRKIYPTKIPTFFATGSADTICFPGTCESWSNLPGTATPKVFAEMTGATHFECQSSEAGLPCPHGWTNYVINWFNCHLKGMQSECDAANLVCTKPTKPMSKTNCVPANSSMVVV